METTTHSVHNRFSLADLAYNAEYEVKIRACGILPDSIDPVCGDWGAKKYHTGIGASGAMPAPTVTFINSTEVKVSIIFIFWGIVGLGLGCGLRLGLGLRLRLRLGFFVKYLR